MDDNHKEDDKKPSLSVLLESFLKDYFNHVWGNREIINEGDMLLAANSESFNIRINKIKEEFNIPDLKSSDDMVVGWATTYDKEVDVESSLWLDGQTQKTKKLFDRRIHEIMKSNKLPPNFYDWIFSYILYGKPQYKPLYNPALLYDVTHNNKDLKASGLNTKEKQWLKKRIREVLKMDSNGRPTNRNKKIIIAFNKLIDSYFSKRRRYRVLNTMLKTLDKKNHKTLTSLYGDIIDEHFPDQPPTLDGKLLKKLRKQRERAIKKFSNNKKKQKR